MCVWVDKDSDNSINLSRMTQHVLKTHMLETHNEEPVPMLCISPPPLSSPSSGWPLVGLNMLKDHRPGCRGLAPARTLHSHSLAARISTN